MSDDEVASSNETVWEGSLEIKVTPKEELIDGSRGRHKIGSKVLRDREGKLALLNKVSEKIKDIQKKGDITSDDDRVISIDDQINNLQNDKDFLELIELIKQQDKYYVSLEENPAERAKELLDILKDSEKRDAELEKAGKEVEKAKKDRDIDQLRSDVKADISEFEHILEETIKGAKELLTSLKEGKKSEYSIQDLKKFLQDAEAYQKKIAEEKSKLDEATTKEELRKIGGEITDEIKKKAEPLYKAADESKVTNIKVESITVTVDAEGKLKIEINDDDYTKLPEKIKTQVEEQIKQAFENYQAKGHSADSKSSISHEAVSPIEDGQKVYVNLELNTDELDLDIDPSGPDDEAKLKVAHSSAPPEEPDADEREDDKHKKGAFLVIEEETPEESSNPQASGSAMWVLATAIAKPEPPHPVIDMIDARRENPGHKDELGALVALAKFWGTTNKTGDSQVSILDGLYKKYGQGNADTTYDNKERREILESEYAKHICGREDGILLEEDRAGFEQFKNYQWREYADLPNGIANLKVDPEKPEPMDPQKWSICNAEGESRILVHSLNGYGVPETTATETPATTPGLFTATLGDEAPQQTTVKTYAKMPSSTSLDGDTSSMSGKDFKHAVQDASATAAFVHSEFRAKGTSTANKKFVIRNDKGVELSPEKCNELLSTREVVDFMCKVVAINKGSNPPISHKVLEKQLGSHPCFQNGGITLEKAFDKAQDLIHEGKDPNGACENVSQLLSALETRPPHDYYNNANYTDPKSEYSALMNAHLKDKKASVDADLALRTDPSLGSKDPEDSVDLKGANPPAGLGVLKRK